MKILITGGRGQVGTELQIQLRSVAELYAPQRSELDLADADAVRTYLDTLHPDLILNAAAYTGVDQAEAEPEVARRLNADLPKQLAAWCAEHGKGLVHYSTDYVYSGAGDQPWHEQSPTAPLNCYGATKLEGDLAVLSSPCAHLIFRTSWVYSPWGKNFMKTMLKLGATHERLRVVQDQVGAPTPAELIAQITKRVLILNPDQATSSHFLIPDGLYHLTTRGATSWWGFAQAIFEKAREQGYALKVSEIQGIPTQEYPTPATRPLNSRLSLQKLETALGMPMPEWRSALNINVGEKS